MKRKIVAGVNDGEVGIWWISPKGNVWKQSCLLDEAEEDNNFLQYSTERNHLTDWSKTVRENVSDSQEQEEIIGRGYKSLERGRVIFDLRTQSYLIVCSQTVSKDYNILLKIADAFFLPRGRIDVEVNSHYYLYTQGQNPILDKFEFSF